jgi:circadian clock protein KaiC
MAMEVPELLGTSQLTGHGISSIADNVILMRYVEVGGHLERAISVLKARGVAHAKELRRLSITTRGLEVGDPFTDLRGVLTGIPIPMQVNPGRP